jgi:hypothetical protein
MKISSDIPTIYEAEVVRRKVWRFMSKSKLLEQSMVPMF